jgi:hypothetical protein
LIDGQQRTTTAFLTLCAIRDAFTELGAAAPDELKGQIADSTTNWQGETTHRLRLTLQYEDAGDILDRYARGEAATAPKDGSRSIRNIGAAYTTIREFLATIFGQDSAELRRFYGYLTNKVKVIRIETPTVAAALKIFETINHRGVGLDAMDLLKNLLFMHAKGEQFTKLKRLWKQLTDEIYRVREKPLRFLRYYLMATYDADGRLREDGIYDWFRKNAASTGHTVQPMTFAERLLEGAKAYASFSGGRDANGKEQPGIVNTRLLGGPSIKQHFVVLLAGRHLSTDNFGRLADEIEKAMCAWLVSGTSGKDYERRIVDWAHRLRATKNEEFDGFVSHTFAAERAALSRRFEQALLDARAGDFRQFRLRYLLGKLTQYVDLKAYGPSDSRSRLLDYISGGNDIEHILPDKASPEAVAEFGDGATNQDVIQRLGNLLLIEKSINRSLSNGCYSGKIASYAQSKFLLTKCQAACKPHEVGSADKITKAVQSLRCWPQWDRTSVEDRQAFLTELACEVWGVPLGSRRETHLAQERLSAESVESAGIAIRDCSSEPLGTVLIERAIVAFDPPVGIQAEAPMTTFSPVIDTKSREITASEQEFYKQLEKGRPGLCGRLRAFVDSLADLGITPDFPASLVLRWSVSPKAEGRAGFIEKNGKAYFQSGAATARRAGHPEAGELYLKSIAEAVGGSISRYERAPPEVVGADGRAIDVTLILDHAEAWRRSLAELVESLAAIDK